MQLAASLRESEKDRQRSASCPPPSCTPLLFESDRMRHELAKLSKFPADQRWASPFRRRRRPSFHLGGYTQPSSLARSQSVENSYFETLYAG